MSDIKMQEKASTSDSSRGKKISVNSKISHLKLFSERRKKKKMKESEENSWNLQGTIMWIDTQLETHGIRKKDKGDKSLFKK